MLEIRQIKLKADHSEQDLISSINSALFIKDLFKNDIPEYKYQILRKSIDARKKPIIFYIYSVSVHFLNKSEQVESIILKKLNKKNNSKCEVLKYNPVIYIPTKIDDVFISSESNKRPVVVGSGPAGLFCAYILAMAGLKPRVYERGEKVKERKQSVKNYWESGKLNPESNVQFGEGGAGTFSDGKLNTLTKDKYGRQGFVLDTFVKFGAPDRIRYDAKPHIGTDILEDVVQNIREEIIKLGGSFDFSAKVTDIVSNGNCLNAVIVNGSETINTRTAVLAIGHSARDTFLMLQKNKIVMEPKSFAVGFRVSHPQELINESQYGEGYPEYLEAAPYKLANEASNGRRVYSFCMCPGGYVVNASSENNQICVNGMSYSDRASMHANSAIIIGVDPSDFVVDEKVLNNDPLRGMYYQRLIEKKTFDLGNGNIPYQTFSDFEHNTITDESIDIQYSVKGSIKYANLNEIFTKEMNDAFVESMHSFGHKIKGFDDDKTLLFGVEARSSSPVRINRDEYFQCNIKGLYPCGEGAGYAGGIMSAAVDGIKVAEAIINSINNKEG